MGRLSVSNFGGVQSSRGFVSSNIVESRAYPPLYDKCVCHPARSALCVSETSPCGEMIFFYSSCFVSPRTPSRYPPVTFGERTL